MSESVIDTHTPADRASTRSTAKREKSLPVRPKSVVWNPAPEQLRQFAEQMPNARRTEFGNVNVMGVAHGQEKEWVLAHKKAIDEHLESVGIPVEVFHLKVASTIGRTTNTVNRISDGGKKNSRGRRLLRGMNRNRRGRAGSRAARSRGHRGRPTRRLRRGGPQLLG